MNISLVDFLLLMILNLHYCVRFCREIINVALLIRACQNVCREICIAYACLWKCAWITHIIVYVSVEKYAILHCWYVLVETYVIFVEMCLDHLHRCVRFFREIYNLALLICACKSMCNLTLFHMWLDPILLMSMTVSIFLGDFRV